VAKELIIDNNRFDGCRRLLSRWTFHRNKLSENYFMTHPSGLSQLFLFVMKTWEEN